MPRAAAQDSTAATLAVRLAAQTAVTGLEPRLVDTLLTLLPNAHRDRAGNAVVLLGTGAPRRLAVCPLDEPGWIIGRIRPDGYLTLRRVPGPVLPLSDQQLEGQRVAIGTSGGVVPGVVAVRSIHLTRGRSPRGDLPFTADSAVVDVGAGTAAEAARLGIAVLAPVTLAKRPHRYGRDLLAGPSSGRRAACAALLAAARSTRPNTGTVAIAFAVEQRLSQRGVATLAATLGPFDETVVVDAPAAGESQDRPGLGRVRAMTLPVRYAGTPVETVSLGDAERLSAALVEWIRGAP